MQIANLYILHLCAFSLVLFRMLGLFMFTPLLSSNSVPFQTKAMLAAMFAVVVYGAMPPEERALPSIDMMALAPHIALELAIGLCIGVLASIPIVTIETAGHFMGYQMGFSLAQSYNPGLEANLNSLGSMLFYMAITVYFMMGGLDLVVGTLMGTFENIPSGAFDISQTPMQLVLAMLISSLEIAFRIAAPVTAIIFVLLLAMGFLSKTMPQLNVMSVGFAIKIVAGILIFAISVFTVNDVLGDHITDVLTSTRDWATSLTPRGAP